MNAYEEGYEEARLYYEQIIRGINLQHKALVQERDYLLKMLMDRARMEPPPPIVITEANKINTAKVRGHRFDS